MKKILFILITTLVTTLFIKAQPMILVFDTNLSEGTTVTLPLSGELNVVVNWGDGNLETVTNSGNVNHTYLNNGEYTVQISGSLTHFGGFYSNEDKLIKVIDFGNLGITSFSYAFFNAINLIEVPLSLPSTVTDLSNMFLNATSFNYDISNWNTANVTNMWGMFSSATSFNQNIGNWNHLFSY